MGGNYSAMDPMEVPVPDLDKLLNRDGYLKPYEREIRRRLVGKLYINVIFLSKQSSIKYTYRKD